MPISEFTSAQPRIIYAEELDEIRTALVIRIDNMLFGGVAIIDDLRVTFDDDIEYTWDSIGYRAPSHARLRSRTVTSQMGMRWETWGAVMDADAFIRSRAWSQQEPCQLSEVRTLPAPS